MRAREHGLELQLARSVCEGAIGPWHEFVARYSGLIFSVARRYLADFDDETQRDAYVTILEYMYQTGLARYDGRAALSTWVMAISRSRCLDSRRALHGRRRDPAWLASCPKLEQEIFHHYFEDGEDVETICGRFRRRGKTLGAGEITRALDRLEARMDRRLRTRLAYDLHARSVGATSGSLLGFLDQIRVESAAAAEALRPDMQLIERRTRDILDEVAKSVEALDPEDRRVLELHFYRDLTAAQIAREMALDGPRRAYTLIDRAIGHLRRRLRVSEESAVIAPTIDLEGRSMRAGGTRG